MAHDLGRPALFDTALRHRVHPLGNTISGEKVLQEGLYKIEFHTVHGTGTGVIYAVGGKLRGGNSAFAFVGNYTDKGDGIQVKVTTQRHNPDPAFKPLFGADMVTLTLKGVDNGGMVDFEGTALQLPGVAFKATLTRIAD